MHEVIDYLNQSIEDDYFSRSEKRSLKALISDKHLDEHQLQVLRSKVFDIAHEKANAKNFGLVIQWVENTIKAITGSIKHDTSEAYFSPGKACRSAIIHQIIQAVKKIDICVFTISDDLIVNAILSAHKKGIDIKVLTDDDKTKDLGSDIEQLSKEGVAVKIDDTPNHMHHKFMVVDDQTLITGSYNWTRSAAKYNYENILLTKDPGAIKAYLNEFNKLWNSMVDY